MLIAAIQRLAAEVIRGQIHQLKIRARRAVEDDDFFAQASLERGHIAEAMVVTDVVLA
jgi:hypothetical protein